jgi:hypothetical protein
MAKKSHPRGGLLVFPKGETAFKQDGIWLDRRKGARRLCEMNDRALAVELESRGYKILWPAHECVDLPHLSCPACEQDILRAVSIA